MASQRKDVHAAPGNPGMAPTWSGGRKNTVGCALGPSRFWFTLGRGIVNEVYYPRIDTPQIRDLGFIVADDKGFWVEVKQHNDYTLTPAEPGIPAYEIVHRHPRFELTLRITPDPQRDVLIMDCQLEGDDDLQPYALLAPRLGGTGYDNSAAVDQYRGRRILWAEQGPFGLALAAVDHLQCDAWQDASAGVAGNSDGWQDFNRNGQMRWQYRRAGPGNVALMGKLPRRSVLALGLASSKESAATLALSALARPFEGPWDQQVQDWRDWHATCTGYCDLDMGLPAALHDQLMTSAMVLRTHQDQIFTGAMVASLSIPWGETRDKRGGYHLVWPRDLVESAAALLVLGAHDKAREILRYLIANQHADGHWYQNQWLGGKPYWQGVQLDEAAFPVLLAVALHRRGALKGIEIKRMIELALTFIVNNGPSTDQDRWEENTGVNNFTLAVCIAALVGGADFLDEADKLTALAFADFWNSRIEDWTLVRDTDLARQHGVDCYYIRTAPPHAIMDEEALSETLPIKNRLKDPGLPADAQVSTDFLQLVRFGLRKADAPQILDSVKLMDAMLRADTPNGPVWYRYNGDGYGEHRDGSAYDGTGHGRPWPLLTGERGHYELAAGRDPLPYLETMAAMAGRAGMIPEQVWDAEAIPERRLYPGKATGSAMPLVWAHAEFIKLAYSRAAGETLDRPAAVWKRYGGERPSPADALWTVKAPIDELYTGERFCISLDKAASVRFWTSADKEPRHHGTTEAGLQQHQVLLPIDDLATGDQFFFRIESTGADATAAQHFEVTLTARPD